MICVQENKELLAAYLDSYGIPVKQQQLELLLTHLDLVVEKNKVLNLTRIVEARDAIIRHCVDSLLLLATLPSCAEQRRFLDIGTGAGFPGIPLGIMTDDLGVLIDSVTKKSKAVDEFIGQLGLSDRLVARSIRAEELALEEPASFDYVVARAVADLATLVEYASPLLKNDGYLIVSKANIDEQELRRGMKTADLVGLQRVSRETFELPNGQGHRETYLFQKKNPSKVRLPRKPGMAKHKPLVA